MKKRKKGQTIYILEQFYSLLLIIPLVIFLAFFFKAINYKKVDVDLLREVNDLFLTEKIFVYNLEDKIPKTSETSVLIVYCNNEFTSSSLYLECDYKLIFSDQNS